MKRNRSTAPALGMLELTPRHWRGGESLPPFHARTPRGGWTLEATARAAWRYADTHALGGPGAFAAFRAIADHFYVSLLRAEIRARLAGGDPLAPTH